MIPHDGKAQRRTNSAKELIELESRTDLDEWDIIKRKILREQKEIMDACDARRPTFYHEGIILNAYYNLEGNPCSMWEWSGIVKSDEQVVKQDQIGPYLVSTVFIGLPSLCNGLKIFETMIFCGKEDHEFKDFQECWDTIEEARVGHESACSKVRQLRSYLIEPA